MRFELGGGSPLIECLPDDRRRWPKHHRSAVEWASNDQPHADPSPRHHSVPNRGGRPGGQKQPSVPVEEQRAISEYCVGGLTGGHCPLSRISVFVGSVCELMSAG